MYTGKLLLHACCGACSSMPVLRLREAGFAITAFFANPNIHPFGEYLRRREAMAICAEALTLPVIWQDDGWDKNRFFCFPAASNALFVPVEYQQSTLLPQKSTFSLPEKQNSTVFKDTLRRCTACCATRLELTAQAAAAQGFTHYSSTLLYSRYQPHEAIADAGARFAAVYDLTFVYQDFRTDWQQGVDISKQMNLYRQKYCGCIFSEAERRTKKLKNAHTILDEQVKNA